MRRLPYLRQEIVAVYPGCQRVFFACCSIFAANNSENTSGTQGSLCLKLNFFSISAISS